MYLKVAQMHMQTSFILGEDLIDITQRDNPSNRENNNDKRPLLLDWSDVENFWNGKVYDKTRPRSQGMDIFKPQKEIVRIVIEMQICTLIVTEQKSNCRYPLSSHLQAG